MFDWLKPYSLIEFREEERRTFPPDRYRFGKKETVEKTADNMTALGQYFTAAAMAMGLSEQEYEHMVVDLPAPDEDIKRLILTEIAPHFTQVQQNVEVDNTPLIRMQGLRREAKPLFARTVTEALPIIQDLYRQPGRQEQQYKERRTILHYPVNTGRLKPYEPERPEELEGLKNLLTKAFIESGKEFNIVPSGWRFDEELCESPALRFLGSFVPAIGLYVDDNTCEVVMLQLARQDMKHPIILRKEKPGQTRIKDSFLYFYISGGLVYVIDLRDQTPVEQWEDLKSCLLFHLDPDTRFSEFDHTSSVQVREGISLLFSLDTIRGMVETVNRCIQPDWRADK